MRPNFLIIFPSLPPRKSNMQVLFFLILLSTVPALSDDCFRPGECLSSLVASVALTDTAEDCRQFCQDIPECSHFTYYQSERECLAFKNCVNYSNSSCSDCVSGERDCTLLECWFAGRCEGTFVDLGHAETENECLALCFDDYDCSWFTFNRADYTCLLVSSCEDVNDGCDSCVSGQAGCDKRPESTKLFVATGDPDEAARDAEVVDLTDVHTICRKPPNYPVDMEGGVGVMYENSLLVCGGSGPSDLCYSYSPNTSSWSKTMELLEPRYQAVAINVAHDEVWIMGGEDADGKPLSSTELLKNFALTTGPELPEPMARFCSVRINSTHLFVSSGRSYSTITDSIFVSDKTYLQNLATKEWLLLPPLMEARYGHACGVFRSEEDQEDMVVVTGGRDTDSTEVLSLSRLPLAWVAGPMTPQQVGYGRVVQFEKDFLLVGGASYAGATTRLDSVFHFDGQWRIKTQKLALARDSPIVMAVPDYWTSCT